MHNHNSLDTLAAALAYAIGVEAPACAASPNPDLVKYIDETLGCGGADRIFMYNPDAVAEWIYRKYPDLTKEVAKHSYTRHAYVGQAWGQEAPQAVPHYLLT